MTTTTITVPGTLQPDGLTLNLEEKLTLPPGRVSVTVQFIGAKSGPTMLEVLDRIHQDQEQRGHVSLTEKEMSTEIAKMRADDEEYEKRWREIWSQTDKKNDQVDNP